MSHSPTILWFRNDLRIADNSALAASIETGGPVVPVYIDEPEAGGNWSRGAASNWFLRQALDSLRKRLREHGGELLLRKGQPAKILRELAETTGARRVHWNRRYEAPAREADAVTKRLLTEAGLTVKSFNSSLLIEPHTVSSGSGRPYKVYTPFFKAAQKQKVEAPATVELNQLTFATKRIEAIDLEDFPILPEHDEPHKLEAHWAVSEEAAFKRLLRFIDQSVAAYAETRDRPDLDGASSLSPYLRFGLIGPRQVIHQMAQSRDLEATGPQVFRKEIYWREFAYHVLYHFPHTAEEPLRPEFKNFPWERDASVLQRWQNGQTGYPIVDAGMRQLRESGWMHNRVRMITASLLVKHLLHSWKEGARWFWRSLVDADLACNTLGWQWSSGCGADAAPYFRVFNPIIQGRKFDPDGNYVKRWAPELRRLPAAYIHAPWEAPSAVLEQAGIELGKDYPKAIIEHQKGRARALAAFAQLNSQTP